MAGLTVSPNDEDASKSLSTESSHAIKAEASDFEELEEDDDEEEEEEEEEEEDDDEDDEDPPILHYQRLTQIPKTFFSKEIVTASLIHEALYAFGTSSGLLHVTTPNFESIGTIRSRKSPILSIHTDGFTIIACSMDGTIMISNTQNFTNVSAHDLKVPTYCVVINGNYRDTKSFIYGTKNGQVVQSTLSWLGNRVEKILFDNKGSGAIVKFEILGDLLIWFSDDGITFYSLSQEKILKTIKRAIDGNTLPAELVWPKTCLIEHDRIVVGWTNKVWGFKIDGLASNLGSSSQNNFRLSSTMSSFQRSQEISINTEFQFKLEEGSLIAGIGSFKDDSLVLLTIGENQGKLETPPELRIINSLNHEEISTDEIVLKNFQRLRVNDIQLGQYIKNSFKYFIVSSTDGIVAEEIDLQGRYDWLVEKNRYLEAWEISEHLVPESERVKIGVKQVQKFLDEGDDWESAKTFLRKVLENVESEELLEENWEQWSWIFIHSGKFLELASILPTTKKLSETYYDECLIYFLNNDVIKFIQYINRWNDLFNFPLVKSKAEQFLEINQDVKVRRCLTELYLKKNEPSLAIPHLVKLEDSRTIDVLSQNHLLQQFIHYLPTVIKFQISQDVLTYGIIDQIQEKSEKLIDIMVQSRHEIIPQHFIRLLDSNDLQVISFLYLKKLSTIDEFTMINFETEMVSLYSKFEPQSLLKYLKHKQHYDIDQAMEIMSKNGHYKELVYLLGKIGKSREAMILLIDEMNDAKRAVDFAIESRDSELWEILITKGLDKPDFLKTLIEDAGDMLDAKTLKRVSPGVEVPGLKALLVKMFNENSLTLSLQYSILKIIESEGIENSDILNSMRITGKVYEAL